MSLSPRLPPLRLGASAFTAPGWRGSFYPADLSSRDFLAYYAEEFSTVELDMTWYRVPTPAMVANWYAKTPADFVFSAKVPQTITHDKVLVDCEDEVREFLDAMRGLREKLGPLLLQFPHFRAEYFGSLTEFLAVLDPFLAQLPRDLRFAVEVRNREWVGASLFDALRAHGVAFAMTDRVRSAGLAAVTADFLYVRWLGDRAQMEEITKTFDRTVLDRTADLARWANLLAEARRRGIAIYGYVSNHFAGHSPDTIRALLDLLAPDQRKPRLARPATLFDL